MDLPGQQRPNSKKEEKQDFPDIKIGELLGKPRAIQIAFHSLGKNGKLELKWNEKILEKIFRHERYADKKVICIPIVGNARTGKSTLLNFYLRLLQKMERREPVSLLNGIDDENENELYTEFVNGFQWVGGDKALTNGIWMWSRPFVLKDDYEREVVVILLDPEGGNTARDDNEAEDDNCLDAQYFSICSLLSSILMYNVEGKGTPNKENLNSLLQFTKYGMVVNNRKSPFQNLCFVRRNLPPSLAGIDDQSLEKFSKQTKYGIILKNSNVNVSVYKLPAPNHALADSNVHKQKLLAGKCTVQEVGRDFLEHVSQQFKLMLPMDEDGRIDDNVLKSRMLETGQLHFYTCEEFHSLLKNIFQTFQEMDFIDPDEFPSLYPAKRAKEAALQYLKNAVNNDKHTQSGTQLDLRTINGIFNEHISAGLEVYKMVHSTCSEAEPGKENMLRGKPEHFVSQGKAFLADGQEFYNEYRENNDNKNDQSWWEYVKGMTKGGVVGGAAGYAACSAAGYSQAAVAILLATKPVTVVCGLGLFGAAIGYGLVKRSTNRNLLNSPNFIQLFINEKAEELGTLYAYRIQTNLATRKFEIFDNKNKLIKSGKIHDDLKSFLAENENSGI